MQFVRYRSKLPRFSVITRWASGAMDPLTSSKTRLPRAASSSRLALPFFTASRSAFAVVCSVAPTDSVASRSTSEIASSSALRPASSAIRAVCAFSFDAPSRM